MKAIIAILILATGLVFGGAARADFQEGLDAYDRGDYATALREWGPLAEQGYADAQNKLGLMYADGRGVLQNYTEAVKWYRKAAKQGFVDAQYNLGFMYFNGFGVEDPQTYRASRDKERGHMWVNIGSLDGSEQGRKNRNLFATEMKPNEIKRAHEMARRCMESDYEDC